MSSLYAGFVADSFRFGSNHAPWYETVLLLGGSAIAGAACLLTLLRLRRRVPGARPAAINGRHWL